MNFGTRGAKGAPRPCRALAEGARGGSGPNVAEVGVGEGEGLELVLVDVPEDGGVGGRQGRLLLGEVRVEVVRVLPRLDLRPERRLQATLL